MVSLDSLFTSLYDSLLALVETMERRKLKWVGRFIFSGTFIRNKTIFRYEIKLFTKQ